MLLRPPFVVSRHPLDGCELNFLLEQENPMTRSDKTTLNMKLADADSESLGSLPIRIEASDFAISIYPAGHGDFSSEDGHGCPLFIEYYQGRLRVIAFPDINKEDPQIIDLSGSREDHRSSADTRLNNERRDNDYAAF
jgi:hypothetical protein